MCSVVISYAGSVSSHAVDAEPLNISLLSYIIILHSVHMIGYLLLYLSLFFWFYFLICKTWMIFYDYQWTYYTLSSQWTSIINADSIPSNWFLQNRKTFGNLHWIAKILAPIFIICCVIAYLSNYMLMFSGNYILFIIGCFGFVVPPFMILISYIIILCKTPHLQQIDDVFYIHWESKLLAKVYGIGLIVFFLCLLLYGLVLILYPNYALWIHTINTFVLPSYIAITIYPSTKLIIDKNQISMKLMVNSTTKEIDMVAQRNHLVSILSNNEALYLFMLHLSHEYSMEILLSFIEFSQYIEYLQEINLKSNGRSAALSVVSSDSEHSVSELDYYKICDSVPLSSIVTNNDDFKTKGYDLYCKYIAVGSEYEINICGRLRRDCRSVMEQYGALQELNTTISDMYQLFQRCRIDMFQLLSYSYARFRKTDDYDKVLLIISDELS